MKNAGHIGGVVPRAPGKANGGFFSLRSISGYLRIVSSGASTVASTVKSAGVSVVSSLAEDDTLRDQVILKLDIFNFDFRDWILAFFFSL